jgi:mannose-6-phosphate isomerase-like protein (cupin superfamily)
MSIRKTNPLRQIKRQPKILALGEGKQVNVDGIEFTYKASGEDTEGHFAFTEGIVAPHRGAPAHIHHLEDEAFYVLEGKFEVECADESFRAGPGSFVLLPKGLPHRFQNISEKPGRLLCVQSPSGVEQFFEHMSALNEEGLPDPERLHQLTAKYGIEFLPDEK